MQVVVLQVAATRFTACGKPVYMNLQTRKIVAQPKAKPYIRIVNRNEPTAPITSRFPKGCIASSRSESALPRLKHPLTPSHPLILPSLRKHLLPNLGVARIAMIAIDA